MSSRLFLASFAALFMELALIRWIPGLVHVVGFFANLVLIACFMGMGLGAATPQRSKEPETDAFLRITGLVALLCPMMFMKIKAAVPQGQYNLNEVSEHHAMQEVGLWLILLVVYGLVMFAFVPVGRMIGRYLKEQPPLQAYSWNIAGSLAGVLGFAAMSYFRLSPMWWLAVGLGSLALLTTRRRMLWLATVAVVVVGVQFAYAREERVMGWSNLWTPYYNLKVFQRQPMPDGFPGGFAAHVNNFFLLAGAPVTRDPQSTEYDLYSLPYAYVPQPKRVLVLGSGGGQDISMALKRGAEHIDAVEIDPVVLELGRHLNPENPYADPRVHVHNTDARAFLKNAPGPYDLVLFGTLDSHGLFSSMSSLKMENFVYTGDALEEARRLLSPTGAVCVTIGFDEEWVYLRLASTMEAIFGRRPQVHLGVATLVTLIDGPALEGATPVDRPFMKPLPPELLEQNLQRWPATSLHPTDDWPHLFLLRKGVPITYLLIGALLVALSVGAVFLSTRGSFRFSPHFFLLGAGFMLLETGGITRLALTFGSTWVTSSVVISLILLVILVANLLLLKRRPANLLPIYALLVASLVGLYLLPLRTLIEGPVLMRWGLGAASIAVPVFLAAIVFASSFAKSDVSSAFASNLMGSVLGGFLEYSAMAWGLNSLLLLAALLYVLSALARRSDPVVEPAQ